MTPDFLSRPTPAAVLAALPGARAVGGAVRDHLAGRPIHDVDIAAPFPPEVIAERLRAAGLRVFETGLAHGTVTALADREGVEVTSLRRDTSTDGRHAQVEWITDWRQDAARRDFTINAMSMAADGVLHDHFDGAADLRAGRVRFVGDAAARIAEDYLRALRFFRFWARYGRGAPDAAAVAAIRAAVPGLARLSRERVWAEIKRLLEAPDPRDALRLMQETGVLAAVLPWTDETALRTFASLVEIGAPVDVPMRLAALLPWEKPRLGSELVREMRASNREAALLRGLALRDHSADDIADEQRVLFLASSAAFSPVNPEDLSQFRVALWDLSNINDRPLDVLLGRLWLREARARVVPAFAHYRNLDHAALRARAAEVPVPVFPLQGREIVALGIEPGPSVGELYDQVRRWWREQGAGPDHAACLARLRELAQNPPP